MLGAAGGAGLAAVEIAKLMGGRVIAVASSADKLAFAKAHGADGGHQLSDGRSEAQAQRADGRNGVDVLYDCVGGPHAEPALRAMAWEGRYLVVGFAAGEIPRFPLNLVMLKGCSVVGVLLERLRRRAIRNSTAPTWSSCSNGAESGQIVPHIHGIFPLVETAKALGLIEGRKVTGKVIVNPQL